MIFDTNFLIWQRATKTQPIKAKPLVSLLVDRSITSKFLVDTLEGKEELKDGVVICIGPFNDVWQQMPKKLLSTYKVVEIDADGWMICEPLPGNSVDCYQVPAEFLAKDEKNYIIGKYGETLACGFQNAQELSPDDYICRHRSDPTDQWVVRKKIFENTYKVHGA